MKEGVAYGRTQRNWTYRGIQRRGVRRRYYAPRLESTAPKATSGEPAHLARPAMARLPGLHDKLCYNRRDVDQPSSPVYLYHSLGLDIDGAQSPAFNADRHCTFPDCITGGIYCRNRPTIRLGSTHCCASVQRDVCIARSLLQHAVALLNT